MFKSVGKLKLLIGLSRHLGKSSPVACKANSTGPFSYAVVTPQPFNATKRHFPADIQLPSYYEDGRSDDHLFAVKISTDADLSRDSKTIEGVREACKLAKQILHNATRFIKVGIDGEF